MAKSLFEARREAAERLRAQVDEITDDVAQGEHPHWTLVADAKALRGIPAISAQGAGSAIPGTRPGENLGLFDDE
jgi:hypothetical protein